MISIKERRKKERRVGKRIFWTALLFFLLFPYLISNFSGIDKQTISYEATQGQIWVLEKKLWGMQKISLEKYLTGMMAATIPAEYELETLKAQAIILRSYCVKQMEKENGQKVIYDEEIKNYYFTPAECENLWGEKTAEYEKKIADAVEATKGMLMVCNGDIVNPPFCRMSNGVTRDITEYVIHKGAYPYMKTALCEHDIEAPEYIQYIEITGKEFEKNVKRLLKNKVEKIERLVLYRDEKGYVKEIEIGNEKIEGEAFRDAFGLVSSCFFLNEINDVIEIQTKGIGHGYGFSQYEANQLAVQGNKYLYLLEYFFESISLEKI